MNKQTDKKQIHHLIFLCAATYFISYMTRLNYAAVVSAFIAESGCPKASAALPLTALSVTYGIGQLLSGYLGDRVPPRHIITAGLLLTTLANLAMPLSSQIGVMVAVWSVNGLAQAMMWPPIVKIMTGAFDEEVYNRACVLVSYGSSAGTITIYLLAPLFVRLSGWRLLFYVSAACSLVMAAVWNLGMNRLEKNGLGKMAWHSKRADIPGDTVQPEGTRTVVHLLGPTLGLIMLAIVFQGMIRDGVTAWMPAFVGDTFRLGDSVSILSGVILPVFSIFAFELTSFISRRWIHNELLCAALLGGVSVLSAGMIYVLRGVSAVLCILMMAVLVGCMHGVNLLLICMLPGAFSRYGNVSMISGLLNFCTYVGSALSTYGMARLTDLFGWNVTVMSWILISLAILVICLGCVRSWQNFKQRPYIPAPDAASAAASPHTIEIKK